ncbi:MAG: N-acetylmuramoyl-L-alanine amidase, partial [Thermoanaerobaculia bacterium]|nr:N-acetylmuramoyl-L-alanine amidase [Thermoanaerobaculia bacterium]
LGSSLPPEVRRAALQAPHEEPAPLSPGVFPLAVRKVVIDPGHGGRNVGTLGPGGLVEKELTLDVALRLEKLLASRGFTVEMTRRDDTQVSLEERAEMANRWRGDIFVSIHVNWLSGARDVRGVETYYLGPTDDPFLNELAAAENRGSGYSMADFRQIVERVYAGARLGESLRLASEVQRALHGALLRISPDLRDRGVKTAPFAVLTGTEMPAILAEVSCLSNEEEARLLRLAEYRQYIAEALAHGIRSYALQSTASPTITGS